MRYLVVAPHRSEFPHPITLARGQALQVGERYEGAEGWDDWYLCEAADQAPGWVPAQVIGGMRRAMPLRRKTTARASWTWTRTRCWWVGAC